MQCPKSITFWREKCYLFRELTVLCPNMIMLRRDNFYLFWGKDHAMSRHYHIVKGKVFFVLEGKVLSV